MPVGRSETECRASGLLRGTLLSPPRKGLGAVFFFFFLATPRYMQDLSSLTRD